MKYTNMLGLLAAVAAALMALAGTASATTLTSQTGTVLGVGTVIKGVNEGAMKLDGTVTVTCQKASGEGEVTNAGGASATVSGFGLIGSLTECGTSTITVVDEGTLELHSLGNGNGTATSSGAEVTILTHNILGTVHCIYGTQNTHIGTVTGSKNNKSTATLSLGSTPIAQVATDGICGEDAVLTGNFVATSPDYIDID